jgi:hypothetical protein
MQFGMLIEYLFEKFPNWQEIGSQAIGDLQVRCLFNAMMQFFVTYLSCIGNMQTYTRWLDLVLDVHVKATRLEEY